MSCFLSGYLADIWGKTKISFYAFLVALLGGAVALISPSLELLILGRFLMGVGLTAAPVLGMAILQERLPEERTLKVFGMMGIIFAVVPGIAPVVGGIMDNAFGWRSNFYIIFLMILTAVALTHFFLEKDTDVQPTTISRNKYHIFKTYGTILSNRTFLAYSIVTPLIYAGEWSTFAFLPFYAEQYLNLDSDAYGLFLGGIIIWYGAGSFIGGRVVKYIGIDRAIYLSLIVALIGSGLLLGIAFVSPASTVLIYMALSLYFLAFGILFPTAVPKALGAFTTLKSSASGLRAMMITITGLLATYAAEVMDDSKLYHLAGFMVIASVAALGSFMMLCPPEEQKN